MSVPFAIISGCVLHMVGVSNFWCWLGGIIVFICSSKIVENKE